MVTQPPLPGGHVITAKGTSVEMFYVENGTFLRFYPVSDRDEALTMAALELGREPARRAYAETDTVPVIYHANDYYIATTPLPQVYALIDAALDMQWWGPDEPGVTLLTHETELISVVFGSEKRANEIAEDYRETISITPYF